jgi:hypothetical protein
MNQATDTKPDIRVIVVAALLHMPGWTLAECDPEGGRQWTHIMHAASGTHLSFSYKAWPMPEHLHVSVVWPRRPGGSWFEFQPSDRAPFSINVGLGKTPEQIARDVLRRLAPAAIEEYRKQLISMRETIRSAETAYEAAKRIAAGCDGSVQPNSSRDDFSVYTHVFDERRGSAHIRVTAGGAGEPAYVNMDIRGLTPEEALAMLALVNSKVPNTKEDDTTEPA